MNELRTRGVQDVLIAVVDGLNGFPDAINAVFPQTQVQTCIVHLLRHAMSFASRKDRRELAAAAADLHGGEHGVAPAWRRQWEQVIPFFAYAPEPRWIIDTTNAIESLNSKLRTAVRSRGHFPNDEAATKLLFLVLREVGREWKMPPRGWAAAKMQFAVMFGERFTAE